MLSLIQRLLFAVAFRGACGFSTMEPQRCETISVSFCHSALPYTLTGFPNLHGDASQASAQGTIGEHADLQNHVNCSKDALFFFCSFFLPMCMPSEMGQSGTVNPCRTLCQRVRKDCSAEIEWPVFINCEKLPEFSDDICIQPDSFINTPENTRK